MKDRELINGALLGLRRRLWLRKTILDTAFGICVVLFCLVCFQLIFPFLLAESAEGALAVRIALLTAFALLAAEIAAQSAKGVTPGQAAVEVDGRAGLKDELKSAYWFSSMQAISPFTQLQVRRAAAAATGLDPAVLAPRMLPNHLLLTGGLGLVLATLTWATPHLSRTWDSTGPRSLAALAPDNLRLLLEDAPQSPEIKKLDLALRELHIGETIEEKCARFRMRGMPSNRQIWKRLQRGTT